MSATDVTIFGPNRWVTKSEPAVPPRRSKIVRALCCLAAGVRACRGLLRLRLSDSVHVCARRRMEKSTPAGASGGRWAGRAKEWRRLRGRARLAWAGAGTSHQAEPAAGGGRRTSGVSGAPDTGKDLPFASTRTPQTGRKKKELYSVKPSRAQPGWLCPADVITCSVSRKFQTYS